MICQTNTQLLLEGLAEKSEDYPDQGKNRKRLEITADLVADREKKKQYLKRYREINKNRLKDLRKHRYQLDPDLFKRRSKRYRDRHREQLRQYHRKMRSLNKQRNSQNLRQWKRRNPDKVYSYYRADLPRHYARRKEKRQTDVGFSIESRLRSRLACSVRRRKTQKADSTVTNCNGGPEWNSSRWSPM